MSPGEQDDGRDILAEIARGDMTLEQRLEHMGIDPAEYKAAVKSDNKARAKMEDWVPKTKEEAQRKWRKLASAPDDTTLMDMFKREGVDILKEGK